MIPVIRLLRTAIGPASRSQAVPAMGVCTSVQPQRCKRRKPEKDKYHKECSGRVPKQEFSAETEPKNEFEGPLPLPAVPHNCKPKDQDPCAPKPIKRFPWERLLEVSTTFILMLGLVYVYVNKWQEHYEEMKEEVEERRELLEEKRQKYDELMMEMEEKKEKEMLDKEAAEREAAEKEAAEKETLMNEEDADDKGNQDDPSKK